MLFSPAAHPTAAPIFQFSAPLILCTIDSLHHRSTPCLTQSPFHSSKGALFPRSLFFIQGSPRALSPFHSSKGAIESSSPPAPFSPLSLVQGSAISNCHLVSPVCLPLSVSPSSSKGAYPAFDFVCLSSICPRFEVDGKGVRHHSTVSSLLCLITIDS